MIFVDSNISMYLVGAAHPSKDTARRILEDCIERGERLVTDGEAFQEILHRYDAIKRRDAIQPAFEALFRVVDEVFPVECRDVAGAKEILLATSEISARDALHLSVMRRRGARRIFSFDRGFDSVPGIERIPRPAEGGG